MNTGGSAGAIINTSPRPRLLIRGFINDEDLVNALRALCPTSRVIETLREVRQDEWDVLVTNRSLTEDQQYTERVRASEHLCVVYVTPRGRKYTTVEERSDWAVDIRSSADHISQEIMRVRGLPERIATLTHEKLEPVLKARESHTHFEEGFHRGTGAIVPIEPFIATPDGKILAGRYKRSERSEAWLLPYDAADIVAWVSAALAEWHGLAPDRFPGVPDWSAKPEWMTPEERLISAEIADVENQRQATLARLSQLDRDLRTRLTDAKEKADRYERALLTTQSEELKQAVIKALTEIGFSVTDADEAAAADDHLEDIHVADPDQEGWIALGEVKGYVRGARTEGLTQFLRFNMRYAVRTGSNPSACWYIVNQFLARDPSTRQPALHGKDEDVHAFGQGNGLVIDTVDLFKLISRVRDGVLTAGEARKLLRESTGKFRL